MQIEKLSIYLSLSIGRRNDRRIVFGQIERHILHEPLERFALEVIAHLELFTYISWIYISSNVIN
jgi:hypothetical protein